jgi:L-rhamnose isomerase
MRIVLQHVRTQLYLLSPDTWTANPFEALDFQHSQTAIEYARQHDLDEVQISVTFADPQFNEVVALPPLHHAPHRPHA